MCLPHSGSPNYTFEIVFYYYYYYYFPFKQVLNCCLSEKLQILEFSRSESLAAAASASACNPVNHSWNEVACCLSCALRIALNDCFLLNLSAMGLSAGSTLKYILWTGTSVMLWYFCFGLACTAVTSVGLAASSQVCVPSVREWYQQVSQHQQCFWNKI